MNSDHAFLKEATIMKPKTKNKTRIKGFQVLENECIWMKAGVINFKTCDQAYDCNDCAFDKD